MDWDKALTESRCNWQQDPNFSVLKSFIPTGHVKFDPPYHEFFYSEKFINAIFDDPKFFLAWRQLNDL